MIWRKNTEIVAFQTRPNKYGALKSPGVICSVTSEVFGFISGENVGVSTETIRSSSFQHHSESHLTASLLAHSELPPQATGETALKPSLLLKSLHFYHQWFLFILSFFIRFTTSITGYQSVSTFFLL